MNIIIYEVGFLQGMKSKNYDSTVRIYSYKEQIRILESLAVNSILEIGIGTKYVYNNLCEQGKDIIGYDIDRNYDPDILGDIRSLPFKEESFECVICSHVIEHLPLEDVLSRILPELIRVTSKYIVLSTPNYPLSVKIFKKIVKGNYWESKSHRWELGRTITIKNFVEMIKRRLPKELNIAYYGFGPLYPLHHFINHKMYDKTLSKVIDLRTKNYMKNCFDFYLIMSK